MRNPRHRTTTDEKCTRCGSGLQSCRCRGAELDGGCRKAACSCWSELCCECGDLYARRFVGTLLSC